MPSNELNDAAVLDQLREHWKKVAALLVWKLGGGKPVKISSKDIEEYTKANAAGDGILCIIGTHDGFEFSIVTAEQASRLIAHNETQRGRA